MAAVGDVRFTSKPAVRFAQNRVIARRHGGTGNLDPVLPFKD